MHKYMYTCLCLYATLYSLYMYNVQVLPILSFLWLFFFHYFPFFLSLMLVCYTHNSCICTYCMK